MNPFDYRPADADDDLGTLGLSASVRPLAGGTDLLPLMKLGLALPAQLVDLKTSGLSLDIEGTGEGWRLGALVTLRRVQTHEGLRRHATALAEAVDQAATAQLRNRATLAGNLLQRPRCWYFRHEHVRCLAQWLEIEQRLVHVEGNGGGASRHPPPVPAAPPPQTPIEEGDRSRVSTVRRRRLQRHPCWQRRRRPRLGWPRWRGGEASCSGSRRSPPSWRLTSSSTRC